MKATIEIRPRAPFRPYLERKERWACLVVHRRGGKTFACIQDLISKALTYKRPGPPLRYAYLAPTRDQAKDIAWSYIKQFCGLLPGIKINEADLMVTFHNGASIRLYSGENYERMRGLYFDGVIIDESGDIDPMAWQSVIRPCLTDYKGWATFIGTPKGRNAFYRWHVQASSDQDWFSLVLKASESGLIPEEELADLQKGMSKEMIQQEFECDFSVGIPGAIYARHVEDARASKRIIPFPSHDKSEPVWTTWDLGSPKNTRVIYWQFVGREIHIIDHDTGLDLEPQDRVGHMKAKGYSYAGHLLPHDAAAVEKSGLNFQQQLSRAGLTDIKIIPRCVEAWTGINKMLELFPRIVINADKCEGLIESLEAYHCKEERKSTHITNIIVHDWASHDSDAFRYMGEAMGANMLKGGAEVIRSSKPSHMRQTKARAGKYS